MTMRVTRKEQIGEVWLNDETGMFTAECGAQDCDWAVADVAIGFATGQLRDHATKEHPHRDPVYRVFEEIV